MAGSDGNQCIVFVIVGVVGIGILLTVILVPMSFSGLEYHEVRIDPL